MLRFPFVAMLLSGVALSACTLAPAYERPVLPVAQAFPNATDGAGRGSAADLPVDAVFQDPRLRAVIALALSNNRDLRVAVANIERARAQYRVQRSDLLPTISASAAYTRSRTPASTSAAGVTADIEQYSAGVGFASYELDLFGRIRSLSAAALESYFATEEDRRTAQISLIAETANNYLILAADRDLLRIAQEALKTREDTLALSRRRFNAGATSQLDLRQAETLTEQARSDTATATANVAQAMNALRLVVGAEVPAELLPAAGVAEIAILPELPAGLPSEVLTQRPDVRSAEHSLKAQNANIGAARAAFFPSISLTGSAGSASPDIGGLFASGSGAWSFAPQVNLPIFTGGANRANLGAARANRDIAVAQYEKTVQTAFREVADALAVRATIRDQVAAQERLLVAATDSQRLSQIRYNRGVDSYLTLLDAQRTLYAAQQTLISAQLTEAANRVELYRAVGGGAPSDPKTS